MAIIIYVLQDGYKILTSRENITEMKMEDNFTTDIVPLWIYFDENF